MYVQHDPGANSRSLYYLLGYPNGLTSEEWDFMAI